MRVHGRVPLFTGCVNGVVSVTVVVGVRACLTFTQRTGAQLVRTNFKPVRRTHAANSQQWLHWRACHAGR